jgi:hypothetical protein
MSQALEPFGDPPRTVPTRDQPSPTDAAGASASDREWEHTRDMLAILMTVLAAHDGISSARSTALACWKEANSMARALRESSRLSTKSGREQGEAA